MRKSLGSVPNERLTFSTGYWQTQKAFLFDIEISFTFQCQILLFCQSIFRSSFNLRKVLRVKLSSNRIWALDKRWMETSGGEINFPSRKLSQNSQEKFSDEWDSLIQYLSEKASFSCFKSCLDVVTDCVCVWDCSSFHHPRILLLLLVGSIIECVCQPYNKSHYRINHSTQAADNLRSTSDPRKLNFRDKLIQLNLVKPSTSVAHLLSRFKIKRQTVWHCEMINIYIKSNF